MCWLLIAGMDCDLKDMVYLLGVGHRVQAKPQDAVCTEEQTQFCECLSAAIEKIGPSIVAEEFSQYALEKLRTDQGIVYESVTKPIADSFKVEHRFCDPDKNERATIGYVEGSELALQLAMSSLNLSNAEINNRGFAIEIARYWPIREKFWFDQ